MDWAPNGSTDHKSVPVAGKAFCRLRGQMRWTRGVTRSVVVAWLTTALAVLGPVAVAQAKFPDRPVKLILPFGAGGVADVTTRIVAERLSDLLGQPFVVENMPGAGGIQAARAVLSAVPDGYTLGLITNGTAISSATFKALPFDPVKDFEVVSTLGTFDLVFAVNDNSPFRTVAEFIDAAKQKPGRLDIGTVSAGSTQNLGAELFKSMANIDVQIVPYKNSPDIVAALLRNDVAMLVDFPPAIRGQVEAKKLRILAASSPSRSALMPDVPTVAESGLEGYDVTAWNGVFAAKGTPAEVIEIMNRALREVLTMPDVRSRFEQVGVRALPGSPAELMARLVADIKKWKDVAEKAGIERK
jgi:tripartite-type tricarboxylate transporter receptor subunit TctC